MGDEEMATTPNTLAGRCPPTPNPGGGRVFPLEQRLISARRLWPVTLRCSGLVVILCPASELLSQ